MPSDSISPETARILNEPENNRKKELEEYKQKLAREKEARRAERRKRHEEGKK